MNNSGMVSFGRFWEILIDLRAFWEFLVDFSHLFVGRAKRQGLSRFEPKNTPNHKTYQNPTNQHISSHTSPMYYPIPIPTLTFV